MHSLLASENSESHPKKRVAREQVPCGNTIAGWSMSLFVGGTISCNATLAPLHIQERQRTIARRFIWIPNVFALFGFKTAEKGFAVVRWTKKPRVGCEIWLKNWPTGPVFFETELDHPKPWGEFPWQAWWFSLDFGSQGFFFQSFGRDLQQWLPLQLRTEQWKDCFVQGMDSCILAAWHGRPVKGWLDWVCQAAQAIFIYVKMDGGK